jgi:RES domain-containing protein
MRVWRLVAPHHVAGAMSGEGAALYGGRWNPVGQRMVYAADSLALATLELVVHLTGAKVTYTAIEFDVPDRSVVKLDPARLKRRWADDASATQRIGRDWMESAASLALAVPSALVDGRSGERNVLLNADHARMTRVRQIQRFIVVLDQRLTG